jgi:hypothetical protein
MISISLTEFVDFVIKSGTPKLTVVKTIKKLHRDGYHPSKDYYRKLRDGIVDMHRNGKPITALDTLCASIFEKSKKFNYPIMASAYKKFVGRKQYAWFEPPRTTWNHGDLVVNINPELGLDDGVERAIKLYFKRDALGKREIDVITHLMSIASPRPKATRQYCVLDIRQMKLIAGGAIDSAITSLLQGEALSFATMYEAV